MLGSVETQLYMADPKKQDHIMDIQQGSPVDDKPTRAGSTIRQKQPICTQLLYIPVIC